MTNESQYEWINDLVDGQLHGDELDRALQKIDQDLELQQYYQQLLVNRELLKSLPKQNLNSAFKKNLMQQIEAVAAQRSNCNDSQLSPGTLSPAERPRQAKTSWFTIAASCGAVAALLLVSLFLFSPEPLASIAHHTSDDSSVADKHVDKEHAAALEDLPPIETATSDAAQNLANVEMASESNSEVAQNRPMGRASGQSKIRPADQPGHGFGNNVAANSLDANLRTTAKKQAEQWEVVELTGQQSANLNQLLALSDITIKDFVSEETAAHRQSNPAAGAGKRATSMSATEYANGKAGMSRFADGTERSKEDDGAECKNLRSSSSKAVGSGGKLSVSGEYELVVVNAPAEKIQQVLSRLQVKLRSRSAYNNQGNDSKGARLQKEGGMAIRSQIDPSSLKRDLTNKDKILKSNNKHRFLTRDEDFLNQLLSHKMRHPSTAFRVRFDSTDMEKLRSDASHTARVKSKSNQVELESKKSSGTPHKHSHQRNAPKNIDKHETVQIVDNLKKTISSPKPLNEMGNKRQETVRLLIIIDRSKKQEAVSQETD